AGDQVQSNQTILTLYPVDGLYLRAKVPGNRSDELRRALALGETLRARAHYAGRNFGARLERIAGEADARGVDALLKLDPGADPPLGAFVDLMLERPPAAGTFPLPFAALNGGERVFAVADGRLQVVPIERVGEIRVNGLSEVLVRAQGLPPGSRILVTHLPNAVDGLKVRELEPESESGGTAADAGGSRLPTAPKTGQVR
ncbi:MAG: RND transporter, partial [Chromatiaceae bacterium]